MGEKKIIFPNDKNSIAALPNSVLKWFGMEQNGESLALLDMYLQKEYKNVVIMLLDGMGTCILEKNLAEDGFFRSHLKGSYLSVFPSTTVAATTSAMSGKLPAEHSWLGWDCYYPQIDKNVTTFLNVEKGTEIPAADYNVAWTYTGYEGVVSKINRLGGKAYGAMPFAEPFPDTFEKICDRILTLCNEPGKKYIYSYWNEPDSTMHKQGCYCDASVEVLRNLEKQVQELTDKLEDTLFIVTADHGHMDSKCVALEDYPTIIECLVRMPSIEPRVLNLFVKEEKKQQFEEEFQSFFGEEFLLWPKQKVLDEKLFGAGAEHPTFRDMLGDYLAIAVGDISIFDTREEAEMFIGVHAGLLEDEMVIPLVVIEK